MILNFDSFRLQGYKHAKCDDFCLVDRSKNIAILSDGCSRSDNSYIGSRLMCYAALQVLNNEDNNTQESIRKNTIDILENLLTNINLHPLNSLATLGIMYIKDNEVKILMYGDGCIVTVSKNDDITHHNIKYVNNVSNAPYYPAYIKYLKCIDQYQHKTQDEVYKEIHTVTSESINIKPVYFTENDMTEFTFPLSDLKFVAMSTDGLDSFISKDESYRLDLNDIISEMISFKSPKGRYLNRRMTRTVQDLVKKGISNFDDCTICGLSICENN